MTPASPDNRRKICVVVASRANYARIKSVLSAIRSHPGLELQIVIAASALLSRFGSAIDIMRDDGFEPDATVYVVIEGENPTTMAKSTGLAIVELSTTFENLKPDIVLTVADRFETMATAVAASYMNIILAHTQGGEVTGSIDESVRHAITKLSQVHFPATELSRERLIRMGEDPENIHLTGCPSMDLLPQIADASLDLRFFEQYGGVGQTIYREKPYLVVMQHPVTTEFGQGLDQINETLAAVREFSMQAVWFWPNVDAGSDEISKGLRQFRENDRDAPVHFYRNMTPEDYARLINHCAALVGNSSSGLREGAFLGVPVVNIGGRQNGRERANNVIDVPYERNAIKVGIEKQVDHGRYPREALFGDGKAGASIADQLARCNPKIQKKNMY